MRDEGTARQQRETERMREREREKLISVTGKGQEMLNWCELRMKVEDTNRVIEVERKSKQKNFEGEVGEEEESEVLVTGLSSGGGSSESSGIYEVLLSSLILLLPTRRAGKAVEKESERGRGCAKSQVISLRPHPVMIGTYERQRVPRESAQLPYNREVTLSPPQTKHAVNPPLDVMHLILRLSC